MLRLIANQTVGDPTPTPSPPFQPSLTAKRVNVLWFASLIISLSTASLAILVKQWLRAYIAFASSSPQGQLRIRFFRRGGLETWRVFGIASMLPLLLQLSLGLFFVGLCFFTADIDPIIGNTALPLVCAWAFLLITFTISPIFSARCPYKTPALLTVTTALRVHLWHRFYRFSTASVVVLLGISYCGFAIPILLVLYCLDKAFDRWEKSLEACADLMEKVMDWILSLHEDDWSTPPEENETLTKMTNDLAILVAADATQANIELDLAIMEDALNQRNPPWDETVEFLVQIIGNRAPLTAEFSKDLEAQLIDCSSLSAGTTGAIVHLLNRYVIEKLPGIEEDHTTNSEGLGWRSLSRPKQWATCAFISLYDLSRTIPDPLAPLLDMWFCAKHPLQAKQKLSQPILALLCKRITSGWTTQDLPHALQYIRSLGLPIQSFRDVEEVWGPAWGGSTLGALCRDAAIHLAADMLSNLQGETSDSAQHKHDPSRFFRGPSLIIMLCEIAEHHGVSASYDVVLEEFVRKAFSSGSGEAIWSIFSTILDADEDYQKRQRYCKFLVECDDMGFGIKHDS